MLHTGHQGTPIIALIALFFVYPDVFSGVTPRYPVMLAEVALCSYMLLVREHQLLLSLPCSVVVVTSCELYTLSLTYCLPCVTTPLLPVCSVHMSRYVISEKYCLALLHLRPDLFHSLFRSNR